MLFFYSCFAAGKVKFLIPCLERIKDSTESVIIITISNPKNLLLVMLNKFCQNTICRLRVYKYYKSIMRP